QTGYHGSNVVPKVFDQEENANHPQNYLYDGENAFHLPRLRIILRLCLSEAQESVSNEYRYSSDDVKDCNRHDGDISDLLYTSRETEIPEAGIESHEIRKRR